MNRDFVELLSAFNDHEVGGVAAAVLSREHLIKNKRASGRLQDLADVERLERGEDD